MAFLLSCAPRPISIPLSITFEGLWCECFEVWNKLYLDGLHGNHIEVFKKGPMGSPPRMVLSVDGRMSLDKLKKAIDEKRECPF
jgi:hypothetical protein